MTALVLYINSDGIQTLTDGGAYDASGVLGQYSNKVRTMPQIPALVFARGSGFLCEYAKDIFSHCVAFDDMVATMAMTIKLAALKAKVIDDDYINVSVVIAGFSKQAQEWQAYRMFLREDDGQQCDGSCVLEPLQSFYCEPFPSLDKLAEQGIHILDDSLDIEPTPTSFLKFLEAIRQTPQRLHPGDNPIEGCLCGAFAEHTYLTKDFAQSQIIHRWADEIGQIMNVKGAEFPHPE